MWQRSQMALKIAYRPAVAWTSAAKTTQLSHCCQTRKLLRQRRRRRLQICGTHRLLVNRQFRQITAKRVLHPGVPANDLLRREFTRDKDHNVLPAIIVFDAAVAEAPAPAAAGE
jgi:hypothetical protein